LYPDHLIQNQFTGHKRRQMVMVWIYIASTPGMVYSYLTIRSIRPQSRGIYETEWVSDRLVSKILH